MAPGTYYIVAKGHTFVTICSVCFYNKGNVKHSFEVLQTHLVEVENFKDGTGI